MLQCEITGTAENTFKPGDTLTGTVKLTLNVKSQMKALYVELEGFAKFASPLEDEKEEEKHYFHQKTSFLSKPSSSLLVDMNPGVTNYNFACVLPSYLPSSFEGKCGNIRYTCKAVLEQQGKLKEDCKLPFTVMKSEDLNLISPSLNIPVRKKTSVSILKSLMRPKPIIEASVPFSGFVPGQNIVVTVAVDNKSNTNIESTNLVLERKTQYTSQTPSKRTKDETLIVTQVSGPGVQARHLNKFKLELKVPPVNATIIDVCRVLTCTYELKVLAIMTDRKNVELIFPIRIGTVPIRGTVPATSESCVPSASSVFYLPPPSYDVATGSDLSTTHENNADGSVFVNYPQNEPHKGIKEG